MFFYDFPIIGSESELPLYLESVGLHECRPHILRRDGYPYAQLFYCTKGGGTLVFDGQRHSIKPNTAFFLPRDYPHEYYPDGDVWDIHWVVPSGFAADELLRHFGLTAPTIFTLGSTKTLEHHFRKMHEALIGDRLFGNYRAAGYLYDLLIEFYRLTNAESSEHAKSSAMMKAIDHINGHYSEPITLDELCAVAGVSRQHLCRLFRSSLSMRPMEYAAKRRIQAAKELLSNTSGSVEDIAAECGFCTASYFTKLFRRYEGMTPSQFRRG